MTATKRPPISGERPDDNDENNDEEAGDKYEHRQKGPEDYNKEARDKYLDVENIMNVCTNNADEWLNVRGDC
jgi:hypothetical protein